MEGKGIWGGVVMTKEEKREGLEEILIGWESKTRLSFGKEF
jgi:hypothetical protein